MARPRTHDDAVRGRLLEHASEAISHSGPAGLSLRAVARQAGTTTAAVYSLFGSRDALVAAVVAEGFRRFANRLAGVSLSQDPAADLLELGRAYRYSALADPHFYRVMFATSPAPAAAAGQVAASSAETVRLQQAEPLARPTFLVLQQAVERVLQAQARDAAQAQEIAIRLWALVHGLVSLELGGQLPGDREQREERYLAALRASRV